MKLAQPQSTLWKELPPSPKASSADTAKSLTASFRSFSERGRYLISVGSRLTHSALCGKNRGLGKHESVL